MSTEAPEADWVAKAVSEARLWQRHEEMGAIGGTPKGGVCRLALTAEDTASQAKLAQWVPIFQLTAMLAANPSFPGAAAANQWLRAVSPKLGNTITEVTAVSSTELKAVRRSDLGLTAFELAVLTRWLDNPAFPAFAYPTNAMPGLPLVPGKK